MPRTVILGSARTPVGKLGGGLSSLHPTDLGGIAIKAALERAEVAPEQVEHVVMGQVLQAGSGDPLLYVHGAGGLFWDPLLDALSANDGVIAPELGWAAIDCPSGIGTDLFGDHGRLLLGRLTADLRAPVRAARTRGLRGR